MFAIKTIFNVPPQTPVNQRPAQSIDQIKETIKELEIEIQKVFIRRMVNNLRLCLAQRRESISTHAVLGAGGSAFTLQFSGKIRNYHKNNLDHFN